MDYDIIIVGGGHAGVEAALAASRMGKSVAIVSMDATKLALMSCNPAIGGVGKSHVVKEIDALGGIMGEAADATGIQFRRLNLSRGPAVWSTRVQSDRIAYNQFIVEKIKSDRNIEVIEGEVTELIVKSEQVKGVKTADGRSVSCRAVIIASGTFLGGLIHVGSEQTVAGRYGEKAATKLSNSLRDLGFVTGRLKTGTPPRLDGNTIDFSKCQIQPGDEPIPFFSTRSDRGKFEQTPCYLTKTTAETKKIISENFERSPIFSGQINATGPRYCPSIEDKFFRFADKESHQLFLEPEGNGTNEIYPNGFSTSLPEGIQQQAIRTVIGLEEVEITRPGYAVEYDYCPAYQIKPSLETRAVRGLFFAGQINGTSGYEEAAGQGLMAGINAVLMIESEPPFVLDRSQAYLGVMLDDLTTRSTTEPYRLFTSRAEYRLALREDNSRDRLSKYALKYNLTDPEELRSFEFVQSETKRVISRFEKARVRISDLGDRGSRFIKADNISLEKLLKQPGLTIPEALLFIDQFDFEHAASPEVLERAAIEVRYRGYLDKQEREIEKFRRLEKEIIPESFDYQTVTGLKREALEKFTLFRPGSLGQAGRIEGVTPGDVSVLSVYLLKHKALHR